MVYLHRKLLRLQMIFLQPTKIKVVLWTTLCRQYMLYEFHFHVHTNICYVTQGGYDLLGRTKDQIRTTEQVNAALAACSALRLDGLVILGGILT